MLKGFFRKSKKDKSYDEELKKRLQFSELDENFEEENQNIQTLQVADDLQEYFEKFEKQKTELIKKQAQEQRNRWLEQREKLPKLDISKSFSASQNVIYDKEKEKNKRELDEKFENNEELVNVSKGLHPSGTILSIEDMGLGIYKEKIPQKNYDVIYILLEDRVSPQGLFLSMYRREVAGKLPSHIFKKIKETLKWSREDIEPFLNDEKYKELLPQPKESVKIVKSASEIPEIKENGEVTQENIKYIPHGQELIFEIGNQKKWKAVYWMKDELGYVVAHNTNGNWQLMHIDLLKFIKMKMVKFGKILSPEILQKIKNQVKYGV